MGRYMKDIVLNQPMDVVSTKLEEYLFLNHFRRTDWKGEPVYISTDSRGKERYIKYSYVGGSLHLEAWFKNIFNNEKNISSIMAGTEGKAYKNSLENLISGLHIDTGHRVNSNSFNRAPVQQYFQQPQKQMSQMSQMQQSTMQQPKVQQSQMKQTQMQQPTYQVPMDMPRQSPVLFSNSSNAYIIYGIISLCLAFIMPIFGFIFGCIGLNRARIVGDGADPQKAKIGKICSIIGLVLSVIILVCQIGFSFLPLVNFF